MAAAASAATTTRATTRATGHTGRATGHTGRATGHTGHTGEDKEDPVPLGVRKVHALTQLLTGTGGPGTGTACPDAAAPRTVLYLHADIADLTDALVGVGTAERLGPVTTDQIRTWLARSDVRIQPVIHTDRDDAVEGHQPPHRTRDQVILRDPTCVFPGCTRDARGCDLDHITAYDPTGPPGQTRPTNLAPLCRRHHRAKTSGLWRYTRLPNGHYHWTGPHHPEGITT